jgi:nitronate monooxygenase
MPSELPIVQAPMAGGPSTPALTAAIADAGGCGFVAAGYLSAKGLSQAIATTRTLTGALFGVNLFVPSAPGDPGEVARYGAALQPQAERLGVALGEPRWQDDAYDVELLWMPKTTRSRNASPMANRIHWDVAERTSRAVVRA